MEKIKDLFKRLRIWLLASAGLGILFEIFIFRQTADLLILFLTGLWILTVWLYKFEGRVSIAGALGFLIMCPFLLVFKKDLIAEKAAIWAYIFLAIGVIQLFRENSVGKNNEQEFK